MQNHNKLDDTEWNATIEQSIAALGLHPNLFSFFCEIILHRFKHLVIFVTQGYYVFMSPKDIMSFHTTQRACKEISVKCLSQGHNDVMSNTGIESANLRSPARQSVKFCLFFANFDSSTLPFKSFSGYAPDWARIQ